MKRRDPAIKYPKRKASQKAKRAAATRKVTRSPKVKKRKSLKDLIQQLTTHDKFINFNFYLISLNKLKSAGAWIWLRSVPANTISSMDLCPPVTSSSF